MDRGHSRDRDAVVIQIQGAGGRKDRRRKRNRGGEGLEERQRMKERKTEGLACLGSLWSSEVLRSWTFMGTQKREAG